MTQVTRPLLRDGRVFHVPTKKPTACGYRGTSRVLPWRYDEGGGGKSNRNACAARAIVVATGLPLERVERELALAHSYLHDEPPTDNGWRLDVIGAVVELLGWRWTPVATSSCTTHLHDLGATPSTLIVSLTEHMTVLEPGGIVADKLNASDPGFNVASCVRGWWSKEKP